MNARKKENRMSTTSAPESAKIYAFPKRDPARTEGLGGYKSSVVSIAARRIADVAYGGSWYHDAAIEDARRDLKS